MIIMVVIMSLIMPKGSKMLDSFQNSLNKTKDKQNLSKERSLAFIHSEEKNLDTQDASYHISAKGVLTKYEKSNDND